MTSRPALCWSASASFTARSSIRLNAEGVSAPAVRCRRADLSQAGRSRLPTTSERRVVVRFGERVEVTGIVSYALQLRNADPERRSRGKGRIAPRWRRDLSAEPWILGSWMESGAKQNTRPRHRQMPFPHRPMQETQVGL